MTDSAIDAYLCKLNDSETFKAECTAWLSDVLWNDG